MSEPSGNASVAEKAVSAMPSGEVEPKKGTLEYTFADLMVFFKSLPVPIHRVIPKPLLTLIARLLYMNKLLATHITFDVVMSFWRLIIGIFFREVQPRNAHRIPRTGPIIFVGAPHHNQFFDPLLLASEVHKQASRRTSFLIAKKSTKRRIVGTFSRLIRCIPVVRAQDDIKRGVGYLTVHPSGDPLLIQGIDTQFTAQLRTRSQVVLPKSTQYATAEIAEVISDTEIRLRSPLTGPNVDEALRGELEKDGDARAPGSTFSTMPYVDQREMYSSVYKSLSAGECIGIFPEGGSHDRTDLLPLKAGVVIMALGAMANDPGLDVKIVPVGLSYFHPHKFRSRAVIEFGEPLSVPRDLVTKFEHGGTNKREAIGAMLDIVYDGLKSVTMRAPDYETLMVVQAARRLYMVPGQSHSLSDIVELNRRFIMGYLEMKDDPRIVELRKSVLKYNTHLKQAGLRDHQVERASRSGLRSLGLLLARIVMLLTWGGCALPGAVLNLPVMIIARYVSHYKAKEALAASQVKLYGRDVLATWKVLVSLGFVPALYATYAIIATVIAVRRGWSARAVRRTPLAVLVLLPVISMYTLKFAEVGVDVYKSLPPLVVSLLPGRRKLIDQLQLERRRLSREIHGLVGELAPKIWDDLEWIQHAAPAAQPPPMSEAELQSRVARTGNGSFSHPLTFLDELIFGWGSVPRDAQGDNGVGRNLDDALSVYEHESDAHSNASVPIRPRSRSQSNEFRQRHPSISPRNKSPLAARAESDK